MFRLHFKNVLAVLTFKITKYVDAMIRVALPHPNFQEHIILAVEIINVVFSTEDVTVR